MHRPLSLVLLAGALAACSSAPGPSASPPNNPPGPSTPGPGGPPGGGENARFPIFVSLEQVGASGGDVDVQLAIDVNVPPNYPLLVTATAPAGAQLLSGLPQESINASQRGRIVRVFRVRGALSPQAPLQVIVHGTAPDNSSGLHADKKFPQAPAGPGPQLSPPPPGGRPPTGPRR